jgi:hypothetical protein
MIKNNDKSHKFMLNLFGSARWNEMFESKEDLRVKCGKIWETKQT